MLTDLLLCCLKSDVNLVLRSNSVFSRFIKYAKPRLVIYRSKIIMGIERLKCKLHSSCSIMAICFYDTCIVYLKSASLLRKILSTFYICIICNQTFMQLILLLPVCANGSVIFVIFSQYTLIPNWFKMTPMKAAYISLSINIFFLPIDSINNSNELNISSMRLSLKGVNVSFSWTFSIIYVHLLFIIVLKYAEIFYIF